MGPMGLRATRAHWASWARWAQPTDGRIKNRMGAGGQTVAPIDRHTDDLPYPFPYLIWARAYCNEMRAWIAFMTTRAQVRPSVWRML